MPRNPSYPRSAPAGAGAWPVFRSLSSFSRVDAAQSDRGRYAVERHHVGGRAVVHLVLLGVVRRRVEVFTMISSKRSLTSCSFQKKPCRSCTHSKYYTVTPPALARMSGITNTLLSLQDFVGQRSRRTVGAFAQDLAAIRSAFCDGSRSRWRAGSSTSHSQKHRLVLVHLFAAAEVADRARLLAVLLQRFDIEAVGIVDRAIVLDDRDDLEACPLIRRAAIPPTLPKPWITTRVVSGVRPRASALAV